MIGCCLQTFNQSDLALVPDHQVSRTSDTCSHTMRTRQIWMNSISRTCQTSSYQLAGVAHKWKGECTVEGIDIYDDFEVSDRRIGRFCGKTVPLPIMTTGPNLHFTAYTKSIFRGRGFLAHYSSGEPLRKPNWFSLISSKLGNIRLTETRGLWLPDEPQEGRDRSSAVDECSSTLIPNCNDAAIWVTGNKFENKTVLLATLCGYEKSYEALIGRFQQITIFLKTSPLATGTGFVARYTRFRDDITLMGELNHSLYEDPERTVRLKPYDGHGVGEIETGTITQPNDQRMIFYYEAFQLRGPSRYDICTDEYFELYDGPSRFYPVIGKYCGLDIPPMVVSSGYALSYRARIISNSSHVVMFYKPVTCGGTISVKTPGYFVSPGYPHTLPSNLRCHWRLIPFEGLPVVVEFSDIHMPPLWYWCGDTYTALSGTTAGGEVVDLGRFCGSGRDRTVMGAFKHLDVHLVTGRRANGTGFKAHYKMECGYWLSKSGIFQSPGRTDWHRTGFVCWWGLQIPFGKKILLDINIQLDSETDPDEPCFDEIVKVYDGPNKGWPLLMMKCDTHHRQIMSRGQTMLVQYRVGKNKPKLTFTASFQP
ncbi:hypothetical protein T265_15069, partial [Opisthorchis viverrini]